MQSVPIINNVVSLILAHGDMFLIQLYAIKLSVTCSRLVVFTRNFCFLHQ